MRESAGDGRRPGGRPLVLLPGTAAMKIKERYVFLVCGECDNRNYTTHKRQKAVQAGEEEVLPFCRKRTNHKEKKL